MGVQWFGQAVVAGIEAMLEVHLEAAGNNIVQRAQSQMSTAGAYGLPPADPGDAPHSVTTHLFHSIFNRHKKGQKLAREIGSDSIQGVVMELGAPSSEGWVRQPVAKRSKFMAKKVSKTEGDAIMAYYNPTLSRTFPRLWNPKGSGQWMVIWGFKVTVKARPWLTPAVLNAWSSGDLERIIATGS